MRRLYCGGMNKLTGTSAVHISNQGTLNEDVRLFLEAELKKSSSTVIDDHYEEAGKGESRKFRKGNTLISCILA